MIVSSRYAVLILAIIVGSAGALILWQANMWQSDLKNVPEPVAYNPGPSPTDKEGKTESQCPASSTFAQDPLSKVCAEFASTCDIPQGWMSGCPIIIAEPKSSPPVKTPPKKPGTPEPEDVLQ